MHLNQRKIVVYRWADGSTARIHFKTNNNIDTGVVFFFSFMELPLNSGLGLWLLKDGGVRTVIHHPLELPDDLKRKICGLAADLEARPTIYGDLVQNPSNLNGDLGELKFPRTVSIEEWSKRYDRAKAIYSKKDDDFHLFLGHGYIRFFGDSLCWFGIDRTSYITIHEKDRVEDQVDALTQTNCLIPESDLDTWKQTHLEFGSWVIPANEEVELYRSLGEKLPWWWSPEDLKPWLLNRIDEGL